MLQVNANNMSSKSTYQSTYFELTDTSVQPPGVYGSCAQWSSVLANDIVAHSYSGTISSLRMMSVLSLSSTAKAFNYDFRHCGNASAAQEIVDHIQGYAATAAELLAGVVTSCGHHKWTVKRCSTSMLLPALCVDCEDPCSSLNHCTNDTSTLHMTAPYVISPCVVDACSSANLTLQSEIRILAVEFDEDVVEMKNVNMSMSRDSVHVAMQVDSGSSVYCGILSPTTLQGAQQQLLIQDSVGTSVNDSVSVVVSGLTPSTSYLVGCLAVSPQGVMSSLSQVMSTLRNVTTDCCRKVQVDVLSRAVIASSVVSNVLRISVETVPISDLVVTLVASKLLDNGTVEVLSNLQPRDFTFSSMRSTEAFISLYSPEPGNYSISVLLSGSMDGYSPVYDEGGNNNSTLTVYSEDSAVPAPVLLSAVFAADGSYLSINFDRNTNKGGSETQFQCSVLFVFSCSSSAVCRWTSSKSVTAFVGGNDSSCAAPGSILSLLANASITAKCDADCILWPSASDSFVVIQAPAVAVQPKVQLFAPAVIGVCDDLTLDASTSVGSGGREWSKVTFSVYSLAGVSSALQLFLKTNVTALYPPVPIPAYLIPAGSKVSFTVTLCNFIGACGSATAQVVKKDSSVPLLSLPGSAYRQVYRKNSVLVSSLTAMSNCNGSLSSQVFSYMWTVSLYGVQNLSLASVSKDPSRFLLNPFVLNVKNVYQVCVSAFTASSQSSTACVSVFVERGSVVANLQGGSSRTIFSNETTLFDASSSYDEDIQSATGLDAGLMFNWSCSAIAPAFSPTCEEYLSLGWTFSESLEVTPLPGGSSENQFLVQVLVSDSTFQRSSVASTVVSVIYDGSAVSAVISSQYSKVNPNDVLQLAASIVFPANGTCDILWSVDDPFLSLSLYSLTPVTAAVSSTPLSTAVLYLALAPSSLTPGVSLTFSFSAVMRDTQQVSTASIKIAINAPPISGRFSVSPAAGVELSTVFVFSTRFWLDVDLPLTYQFGSISPAGLRLVALSQSQRTFGSSLLTAGSGVGNVSLPCFVDVFDSLSANSSALSSVVIRQEANRNISSLLTLSDVYLNSSSANVDSLKSSLAIVSFVLNSVNCSLAPNCTELNRLACVATAQTCGACATGFVGTYGDANDPCYEVPTLDVERRLAAASMGCNYSSDCPVFSQCVNHLCYEPPKHCPQNCSGQGVCAFIRSDSGDLLPHCGIGSASCSAVCVCNSDFLYSADCSRPIADSLVLLAIRDNLVRNFLLLFELEDASRPSIASWIEMLVAITMNPLEVSADSSTSLVAVIEQVLSSVAEFKLNYFDSNRLLLALNSLLQSNSHLNRLETRRRLLPESRNRAIDNWALNDAVNASTRVNNVSGAIETYLETVMSSMVPTQESVSVLLSSMRLTAFVMGASWSDASDSIRSLQLPRTALEEFADIGQSEALIPMTSRTADVAVYSLVIAETLFDHGGRFKSNPLTLYASSNPCDSEECRVEVTLQSVDLVPHLELPPYEYFNTSCFDGFPSVNEFACSVGSIQTTYCNGTPGVIYSQCPYTYNSSVCNVLEGGHVNSFSDCQVVNFTNSSVVCSCALFSAERRLVTGESSFKRTYLSMVQHNFVEFADYFVPSPLVERDPLYSDIVYGIAGAVVGCALVLLLALYKTSTRKADSKIKPDGSGAPSSEDGSSKSSYDRLIRQKRGLQQVETSLPFVFSSRPMLLRVTNELFEYHKYLRVWRSNSSFVIPLVCSLLSLLCFLSILVLLIDSNEDYCGQFRTRTKCEEPLSGFGTGERMCEWKVFPTSTVDVYGVCSFVQPDRSILKVLFSAFYAALLVVPIRAVLDHIVKSVLTVPSQTEQRETGVADLRVSLVSRSGRADRIRTQVESILGRLSPSRSHESTGFDLSRVEGSTEEDKLFLPSVSAKGGPGSTKMRELSENDASMSQQVNLLVQTFGLTAMTKEFGIDVIVELLLLLNDIKSYRERLFLSSRFDFDGELHFFLFGLKLIIVSAMWGLNDEGNFLNEDSKTALRPFGSVSAQQRVFADFLLSYRRAKEELCELVQSGCDEDEVGRRLLQMFHVDLLYGARGLVLDNKITRDSPVVVRPTARQVVIGWAVVLLLTAALLIVPVALTARITEERQWTVLFSFLLWLCVDVAIVETLGVLLVHVAIPSLVVLPLKKLTASVALSLESPSSTSSESTFNAANFLFVSNRMAKEYPDRRESRVIRAHTTIWPSPHCEEVLRAKHVKCSGSTISGLMWSVVGFLLNWPILMQDVFWWALVATLGFLFVWAHIALYRIYPVLVALPVLGCVVVVHFYFSHDRAAHASLFASWEQEFLSGAGGSAVRGSPSRSPRKKTKQTSRSTGVFVTPTKVDRSEQYLYKSDAAADDLEGNLYDERFASLADSDEDSGHQAAGKLGEYYSSKYEVNRHPEYRAPVEDDIESPRLSSDIAEQPFGLTKELDVDCATESKHPDSEILTELNEPSRAAVPLLMMSNSIDNSGEEKKFNDSEIERGESLFDVDFDPLAVAAISTVSPEASVEEGRFVDLEFFRDKPVTNKNLYETFKASIPSGVSVGNASEKSVIYDDEQGSREDNDSAEADVDLEFLMKTHSSRVPLVSLPFQEAVDPAVDPALDPAVDPAAVGPVVESNVPPPTESTDDLPFVQEDSKAFPVMPVAHNLLFESEAEPSLRDLSDYPETGVVADKSEYCEDQVLPEETYREFEEFEPNFESEEFGAAFRYSEKYGDDDESFEPTFSENSNDEHDSQDDVDLERLIGRF